MVRSSRKATLLSFNASITLKAVTSQKCKRRAALARTVTAIDSDCKAEVFRRNEMEKGLRAIEELVHQGKYLRRRDQGSRVDQEPKFFIQPELAR